jgi:hypothetical protein
MNQFKQNPKVIPAALVCVEYKRNFTCVSSRWCPDVRTQLKKMKKVF